MYCGKAFEVGEDFRWHFQHKAGFCVTCPTNPTFGRSDATTVTARKDISNVAVKTIEAPTYLIHDISKLFDGNFTIPFQTRDGDRKRHITIRIKTTSKLSKYPGSRRIKVRNANTFVDVGYVKPNGELVFFNLSNNPTFSEEKITVTKKAVQILVFGTEEEQVSFGMYWALLSRKCWRCGRSLTNPETLKLASGLGPICDKIVANKGIDIQKTPEPQVRRIEF